MVARQLTAATHFPGQFSYDAPPDRKQRLCLGEAVSEKLYRLCDATVVPEYRDLVRRFTDVPTLAERLKNEEYISTEYRMCDGSWHSLRFVAKKRDEAGNVTHALCTVRCRAV